MQVLVDWCKCWSSSGNLSECSSMHIKTKIEFQNQTPQSSCQGVSMFSIMMCDNVSRFELLRKNQFSCYGLLLMFHISFANEFTRIVAHKSKRWGIFSVSLSKKGAFFVVACFFFQFLNEPAANQDCSLSSEHSGSYGTVMLSCEMSLRETGGTLCTTLQALCDACTQFTRLV